MTSAHLFFIPMVLTVGVVIGFFLGSRAARDAFVMQQKRDEKRAAAKAARAAGQAQPDSKDP